MDQQADEYVTVATAADVAGIPARTLRYWIETGKLPAVAGKHGKLVRRGDVQQLAMLAGRSGKVTATASLAGDVAAEPATDTAENIASAGNNLPTAATLMQQLVQQVVAPLAEANERQAAELERLHALTREQAEALGRERATKEALHAQLAALERRQARRRPWYLRLLLGG